jgi:pilus assembly protein CpaC
MNKYITYAAATLLIAWGSATTARADANTINLDLFHGELKLLKDIDVERVAIGNGKLLRVELLPQAQMLLIAENVGSTSLHLWHKSGSESDYNIRIMDKDPQQRVRLEKMIQMDVRIVEFRKSRLDELGVDWSKDIAGPSFATAGDFATSTLFRGPSDSGIAENLPLSVKPFQSYFGIATEITSRIKYLESSGDATTLAQPTLSCRNGGSAKFLAGGEVPYPVVNQNGQTSVSFKEYGIKLDVAPVVNQHGLIAAKIGTEVSQIDPSVSVMGSPGFLSRKAETEMNVMEGQTIVLAGLLNRELANNADKVPGVGQLPVLGWLFKSEKYRNNVTELVVFLTPRVVDPAAQSQQALSEKTNTILQQRLDNTREQLRIGILE